MESKENFVYSIFKMEEINEKIANELIETRHQVFPFPIITIIDVRNIKWATGRALKILSSKRAKQNIIMSSTIVSSSIGKFLGNLYYTILEPPFPSKLHTSVNESIIWINKNSGKEFPKFDFIIKVNDTFDINPN